MDFITLALAKEYTKEQLKNAEIGKLEVDKTLSKEGVAADAKAVGQALNEQKTFIGQVVLTNDVYSLVNCTYADLIKAIENNQDVQLCFSSDETFQRYYTLSHKRITNNTGQLIFSLNHSTSLEYIVVNESGYITREQGKLVSQTRKINGHPLSSDITLSSADIGINPIKKTDDMTQPVGVDAAGGLWVDASGGTQDGSGSSGGATETMLVDFTLEEDVSQIDIPLDNAAAAALNSAREIFFELSLTMPSADDGTETGTLTFGIAASWGMNLTLMQGVKCLPTNAVAWADGCNVVGVVTRSKIFRICTGMCTFRVNNTTAVSNMVGGTYSNITGGQTLRAVGSIPIGAGSRIRLYVR